MIVKILAIDVTSIICVYAVQYRNEMIDTRYTRQHHDTLGASLADFADICRSCHRSVSVHTSARDEHNSMYSTSKYTT